MDDPYAPVPPQAAGTLESIDDAGQFHMVWDNGRTLALIPGVDDFTVIRPEFESMKLYMPLAIDCYEKNEWGGYEEYPTAIDPRSAVRYHDNIRAALVKERMPEESERGLMYWYGKEEPVNEKVLSAVFSVAEHSGKLWGTVECRIAEELTPEESDILKDYLAGQASDGWGEGFEQRPIKTSDSEIYVHLWNSSGNWSLMTEEELQNVLKPKQTMKMG
jgi:hypothetical protein